MVVVDKVELESGNKSQISLDGRMIKSCCIKLRADRLGDVKPVSGSSDTPVANPVYHQLSLSADETQNSTFLNEPDTLHVSNLQIARSFDESEILDARQLLREDPIQRLRNTVELILRVYGFSRATLQKRIADHRIHIVSYG